MGNSFGVGETSLRSWLALQPTSPLFGIESASSRDPARTLRSTPYEANTPDVVADNFSSNCCLIVSWEEGRGKLFTQVMNADGSLRSGRTRINSGEGYGPALTYQRQNDRFLVTYKRKTTRSELVAQTVTIGNVAGTAQVVSATPRRPPRLTTSPPTAPRSLGLTAAWSTPNIST